MLPIILALQLLSQEQTTATAGVGKTWENLTSPERCSLLRAVLDAGKDNPRGFPLFGSTCIRDRAKTRGRIVLNAGVRWDIAGVRHFEKFPGGGDGGAAVCGWSDYIALDAVEDQEKTEANHLWQLMLNFYPASNGSTAGEFAFWAQLEPTWPLPRNTGAVSCPPEFGFVRRTEGNWKVRRDKAAREYLPLSPTLRKKKTR